MLTFATFAEWLYLGREADSGDIFTRSHGKDVEHQVEDFTGTIELESRARAKECVDENSAEVRASRYEISKSKMTYHNLEA